MLDVSGNVNASGSVTAASFAGSGSGLTSLNPTNIAAGTAGISITGNAANAATRGGIAPSGYARASSAGQSYLKGLVVNPTYDVKSGYANYLVGIEADPGTKVGSNVAHSVVSFFAGAQPTGGLECSVAFGVNVPNQQTSLCNGSYGFYQGGPAQYNYLGSKVGIGTPFPSQMLDVSGNVNASGGVTAASFTGNGSGLTNVTASS